MPVLDSHPRFWYTSHAQISLKNLFKKLQEILLLKKILLFNHIFQKGVVEILMNILNTDLDIDRCKKNNLKSLADKFLGRIKQNPFFSIIQERLNTPENKKKLFVFAIGLFYLFSALFMEPSSYNKASIISPLAPSFNSITSTAVDDNKYEVFGFAPYWNFTKLDNIDYSVLTTLAYFDIPVAADGNLIQGDGYYAFKGDKATELFKKAHNNGTRVVLTITQMNNYDIEAFLNSDTAQKRAIDQTTELVKKRGIDGVNIDFEYTGDPGQEYRNKFSTFVADFTKKMHKEVPNSKVTVSVYASAIKEPKVYDIQSLSKNSDGIFMMAYDFATASSDSAMPTSPLYGHKEGEYWYDVSSAVEDFLKHMPSEKLILGVPYYGYNYLVSEPGVKAQTLPYWRGSMVQTYSDVEDGNSSNALSGWDDKGKVSWKAYIDSNSYVWRMAFVDDQKSLGIKYDFAKDKKLGGIGIWALGFDEGKSELWELLKDKFGQKTSNNVASRKVNIKNI
ncbi:glycoside hydrolase family 18 protein [Candidatus Parcubacteria bacterium]|nr:MAG: glycoside hydrolase family 18 protein [Candidatus Parcubacteria bacterium]